MTQYWQLQGCKLGLMSVVLSGVSTFSESCTLAQVKPDNTLGDERSVVNPNVVIDGLPSDRIDGGAIRGANLFHSFQEFNVGEGRGVYFTNRAGIENILSRVTGSNPSNIFGKLGVLGNANLFLINPNGIIFGPNASLNVSGSFVGSTASSLNFADGKQFSATAHPTTPLLTVSVPIGLQYGGNAGRILNQSQATNSSGEVVGLAVQPGKTLALMGGDVELDGGNLQALGGRVELGGLAGAGTVGLNVDGNNLRLSFLDRVETDVSLINRASVNVRAGGGGSIAINARNIEISGLSKVQGGIGSGLGSIGAQAGDITLNATGAIKVEQQSAIENNVNDGAIGNGGDINITTGTLSVRGGAQLLTRTSGRGNAGNVTIHAGSTVSLAGFSGNINPTIGSDVLGMGAVGNGGDINITAPSVFLQNEAILAASILYGRGENGSPAQAGNVMITANNQVSLNNSRVYSEVGPGSVGNGGTINIKAPSVSLDNGAVLKTSTSGQGHAGSVMIMGRDTVSLQNSLILSTVEPRAVGNGGNIDIKIEAGSLSLTDGAQLLSLVRAASDQLLGGRGNAGNVNIDVHNAVTLAGVNNGNRERPIRSAVVSNVETGAVGNAGNINIWAGSLSVSNGAQLLSFVREASPPLPGGLGNAGNVSIDVRNAVTLDGVNNRIPSAIQTSVSKGAIGNGGNIDIRAGALSVTNGARLDASSDGEGDAGNISVSVRGTLQANNGTISTSSAQSSGGAINITARDIRLFGNSDNKTNVASGKGNGGNINLTARSIIALEDSDILAYAGGGRGGNITLNTPVFFGFRYASAPTGTDPATLNGNGRVDINASGALSSGDITLPDVDPTQQLATLPAELVEASGLIATGCAAVRENKFIISGRGGLPPSPSDPLSSDTVWTDLRSPTQLAENLPSEKVTNPTSNDPPPIVEATGWVINNKGEVVLTATAPTATPHSPWLTPTDCHAPQNSS